MTTSKRIRKPAALTATARKSALATIAKLARDEGNARATVAQAVLAFCGVKPDKATYADCRSAYRVGRVMGYLVATGYNGEATDCAKEATRILALKGYDADKLTGKARKVPADMRSEAQHKACRAADKYWSDIVMVSGIANPSASAGNSNAGGKPKGKGAGKSTKATQAPVNSVTIPAAINAKFVPPSKADKEGATEYVQRMATALAAWVDSMNQKLMASKTETLPVALCSAVADFREAVGKIK